MNHAVRVRTSTGWQDLALVGPPGPQGVPGPGGTATSITLTPGGNVSSTNVQAAITELDNEKVAKSGDTMTGNLGIGVPNDYPLQVGNGSTWYFAMDHWGTEQDVYSDNAYDAAWAYYGRARGTNAAIASVQNGDAIGGIAWIAADGTLPYANANNATIDGIVDGAVSAGVVPTAIKFNTGSIANAPVERMRIASDGTVYVRPPGGDGSQGFMISHYSGPQTYAQLDNTNNDGYGEGFYSQYGRGTLGAPLALQVTDEIVGIAWAGFEGSNYRGPASVSAVVDATPVAGASMPLGIIFRTGTTAGFERMRIASDGKVTLPSPAAITDATQVVTKAYADTKAPKATISTSAPSGGVDGDVWYQVT